MLGNNCVYSPTYLILKRELLSDVLNLKNKNVEPLKLEISCGPKINKIKGHSKTNDNIKRNKYAWITCHPQVVQSPISNDCLKVIFDYQTETQLFPNFLLQVSVRELHNSLVSDPNDDGLKDARNEENNIIIRDSKLCSLLPPQLKQM